MRVATPSSRQQQQQQQYGRRTGTGLVCAGTVYGALQLSKHRCLAVDPRERAVEVHSHDPVTGGINPKCTEEEARPDLWLPSGADYGHGYGLRVLQTVRVGIYIQELRRE